MTSPPPTSAGSQPRVRRNRWNALTPPQLGEWRPWLSVSVVIPAFQPGPKLDMVLASLAAQSYPSELVEVIVIDDGSEPAVRLPEVRPEHTRLIRASAWGKARACREAVSCSAGEVIHFLDADMVLEHHHLEAHMRWHHQLDYASVLGHKSFVDDDALDWLTPAELRARIGAGELEQLVHGEKQSHDWIEVILDRTEDLAKAGPRAMRVHVGASASMHRALYDECGGHDPDLVLAEDIELGYRLRECGAIFVPEREALSLHLGRSRVMKLQDEVNRHNRPYVADRVPEYRRLRKPYARTYRVPYLEAVLETDDEELESVAQVVDALLASSVSDLVVTLVGPWSELSDARRSPLTDGQLDLRLIHETYRTESRVRFVDELPEGRCPASFRMTFPGTSHVPGLDAVRDLLAQMERSHTGAVAITLPSGAGQVFVERTAAIERTRRLCEPGEPFDQVLKQVYGRQVVDAASVGFVPADDMQIPWPGDVVRAAPETHTNGTDTVAVSVADQQHRAARLREQLRLFGRVAGR